MLLKEKKTYDKIGIMKILLYKLKRYFLRLFHHSSIPFGGILMLHRIDKPDRTAVWNNQHLKLSPDTFVAMVNYAREHKCRFVSLDDMSEAIINKRNVRRCIAITLDDGYRDNFINGTPLFHRLKIPYTIYVCTKMVKGEMLYWWEILERLVLENDNIILNDGRQFDCSTKEAKERAFLEIREVILKIPQENLVEELKKILVNYDIDYQYGNDKLGLTWDQIRELSNDSLCTLGNHTYSHKAFTGCSDKEIIDDISLADKEMYERTNVHTSHFAFPFGEATAVSQHDIDLVKNYGFSTSATTKEGFVCYGSDLQELPRFFVTEKNWKQIIDGIIVNC